MKGGSKKDNFYYFMEEILSSLPTSFEDNFLNIAPHHLIVKQATQWIFLAEINSKKPRFRILMGSLMIENAFLRQLSRVAFYEVIDIAEGLKFCISKAKFKKVKQLAALVILRLFCSLYFECIILPGKRERRGEFIDKFKKYFSQSEMLKVFDIAGFEIRFIFEQHGIDLGFGAQGKDNLEKVLLEFYRQV